MVVEITNVCNLRCSMCPRLSMTRKPKHMEVEFFDDFLRRNHKTLEFVGLNGYGEPLLHPRLFDILEICKKYKVPAGISTNCTMLMGETAQRLIEEGPEHLILAIDSVQRESYEQVRVGADFDRVMQNVRGFLELLSTKKSHTFVVLQCIYMTETKGQIREFIKSFSSFHYDAIRIRQLTYSGNTRTDANYTNPKTPCYWLWTEPMLLSNGQLTVCCQDVNGELSLGSCHNDSLTELWQSERIRHIRQLHAEGKRQGIRICKDCNMYQPTVALSLGATIFNTLTLNKLVPTVETMISKRRYKI